MENNEIDLELLFDKNIEKKSKEQIDQNEYLKKMLQLSEQVEYEKMMNEALAKQQETKGRSK